MRFFEILAMTVGLLHRERRISYRALKREFDLDDAYLEDLRFELICVRGVAVDQGGEFLAWAGDGGQQADVLPAELAHFRVILAHSRQRRRSSCIPLV